MKNDKRNWKLEIGNWQTQTEFQISDFQLPFLMTQSTKAGQ
jgi:hypothetical protein